MSVINKNRVANITRPMVDRDDIVTSATGAMHRVTPVMPDVKEPEEYRKFARKMFEIFLTPLEWDEIIKFEVFIDMCDKPQSWKDTMRECHYNRVKDFDYEEFYRTNSSHIKEEDYDTWKNARTINGTHRKGYAKDHLSWIARYVKSCEKQIYHKLPGLVKGMTPKERMEAMYELGDHMPKTIGDYTSYEASFKRKKMECVQFEFYEFMFQKLPFKNKLMEGMRHVIGGKNKMRFKNFTWYSIARKMSGESDTALSNALDNWVTWLFLLGKKGVPPHQAAEMIYVEGDDNASSLQNHKLDKKDFEDLGLKIKIETGLDIEQTGFCQLYFTLPPTGTICADPWKKLVKFSKAPVKYAQASDKVLNSLLRAQALSMLYLHKGAPVVHKLAERLLYITRGFNVRNHHWESAMKYGFDGNLIKTMKWRDYIDTPVKMEDRVLVERQFGMTIEMQLLIEEKLDSWKGGLLHLPVDWFPDDWALFYSLYATDGVHSSWFSPEGTLRKHHKDTILSFTRKTKSGTNVLFRPARSPGATKYKGFNNKLSQGN
ncbi:hypothetical protein 3 [Beihai tombus-like virus 18]|uniref:hypothetical protein 3 n=1 Tax=Beihai tombus-like virus 18 TaxID=1922721 RepID=UPI00090A4E88|nr:hypothetical protein 3 [Beihai tombus-like virus 18]APG76207.1 hypothetical protein 3 [Beihai tombus-like virus 18]